MANWEVPLSLVHIGNNMQTNGDPKISNLEMRGAAVILQNGGWYGHVLYSN